MKTPSFRDVERLSAYLDGNSSEAERTRLEARLRSDPALAAILEDLRQTRAALRRAPRRRAPRNFTLTPKMAGLRPPVPRAVPALSWASAVTMLLFTCGLGSTLLARLPFGAAAPMMAGAPPGMGGGYDASSPQEYGIGGGAADTEVPTILSTDLAPTSTPAGDIAMAPLPTPTPEIANSQDLQPTPLLVERNGQQPPVAKIPVKPFVLLLYGLVGLAVVLIGAALILRWAAVQRFRKRMASQK